MSHKPFAQRVREFFITTFLGGVVVVLPITLFFWLMRLVFRAIVRFIQPIENLLNLPREWATWVVDLTAAGIAVTGFFLIGLFIQTNFGKKLFLEIEDRLLSPLPFYTILRDAVQQMLGPGKKTPFSEVVLADVFSNSTRMLGFVVDELPDGHLSLFVPTGPNPTTGFIFFVHRSQVEHLEVRPEEAIKVIIGMGTGASMIVDNWRKKPSQAPVGAN